MWNWARRVWGAIRNQVTYPISDPNLLSVFGFGAPNYSGVEVNESSTLSISAVYRAVSLVSGTIATLPMRTLRDTGNGMRQRMTSFLDKPGGPNGPTSFEWIETVLCHLLLHGNAFLAHQRAGGGQMLALIPIHPMCVSVQKREYWPNDETRPVIGGKLFTITLADGSRKDFDATTMTHIPAMSTDGVMGLSPIAVARNSLGTTIAGDRAQSKLFNSGMMTSGMVTTEEDIEEDEAKVLKASIENNSGWDNAGKIPFFNRKLKFTPWTMNPVDAQFLSSRQFQIEEIARWFGVPPHLLMQTEKQTSWGTGVETQNRGLGRYVLSGWTARIEQRLSRLLSDPLFVEFDFAGLERPDPASEIDLLIKQVDAGLLTLNEARAIRNMPPVDGGDEPRGTTPPTPVPQDQPAPEEVPA